MKGFSYNGSLLGNKANESSLDPKIESKHSHILSVANTTKPRKRIRGVFRLEPTPLLFTDIDADFYLDIKQAALALNVTERSIARYRASNQLPYHSLGKRRNFFLKSVIDQIKNYT